VIELAPAVLSRWQTFAVVMGGSTASLLGLLFVAVSIRVETIAQSVELRIRSAQTMALLLTGLLAAVLLAVPGQRRWILGAEYLALALFVTAVTVWLDRQAGGAEGSRVGQLLDAINPTLVACSLLAVAAVVLLVGHWAGIYFLVPALVAVLVGGVVNAWLILVRLTG
jgi:hypothetical protein